MKGSNHVNYTVGGGNAPKKCADINKTKKKTFYVMTLALAAFLFSCIADDYTRARLYCKYQHKSISYICQQNTVLLVTERVHAFRQ